MIRLARPLLGDEEAAAAAEVLASGWLVQGPKVQEFEQTLSPWIGNRAVVACSSGTAALNLALEALALPRGSTVLVPAFTFPATINSVLCAGLQPVLVDVDPATWNLRPDDARALLGQADALLAVHQFGLPAPLWELVDDCAAAEVLVVEDAACALGAELRLGDDWIDAGAVGRMGCFSFHPRKILTTGEGGCVSVGDEGLEARLRRLRNHGMERVDGGIEFVEAGWNFRLTEMQGAIGVVQLGRLEALLADRRRLAEGYAERLAPLAERGLELPVVPERARPTWQSYVLRLPPDADQAAVIAAVRDRGVEVGIGAQALHVHPAYRDLPGCRRPLPGVDEAFRRQLALPVAWGLTDADLDRIADAIGSALGG